MFKNRVILALGWITVFFANVLQGISPEQLAIIFEHIHQTTFFNKHMRRAITSPTVEVFLIECRASASSDADLFKEIFGFNDDTDGQAILTSMFHALQTAVLDPMATLTGFISYTDPIESPFFLALEVAIQLLIQRHKETIFGHWQRRNKCDLLKLQFNLSSVDKSEKEVVNGLVNDFCQKVKAIVDSTNQKHRCQLSVLPGKREQVRSVTF